MNNIQETERLVKNACSSKYSERNVDKSSFLKCKTDEIMEAWMERPEDDKIVIDDDIDSDTINVHVLNSDHGKELLRKFAFHQQYSAQTQLGTDVWHIWKIGVRTIRWDLWSENN